VGDRGRHELVERLTLSKGPEQTVVGFMLAACMLRIGSVTHVEANADVHSNRASTFVYLIPSCTMLAVIPDGTRDQN
jgi:hypothetical protein